VIFLVLALLLGDTSAEDGEASANLEGGPAVLLGLLTLLATASSRPRWARRRASSRSACAS